jgi:hypothetical protein
MVIPGRYPHAHRCLGTAAREKIGNGAAIDLMGGSPDECPERYAVADPLSQVPIPAVVRCVHARAGDRVPFAESVTYVDAATAAGQDAQLLGRRQSFLDRRYLLVGVADGR